MWIIFWRIKVKKHEKSAVFDFILITILLFFAGFIVFMKIELEMEEVWKTSQMPGIPVIIKRFP